MLSFGDHLLGRGAAQRSRGPLALPDPATVVVVGGGPAGSFFAIRLLRRARRSGRTVRVVILEKKTRDLLLPARGLLLLGGLQLSAPAASPPAWPTSSTRKGSRLPDEIVESRADEVVVHGDWKSVRLPVPRGAGDALCVPRVAAPPADRPLRELRLLPAPHGHRRGRRDDHRRGGPRELRPPRAGRSSATVSCPRQGNDETSRRTSPSSPAASTAPRGMDLAADPLFRELQAMIPGLRPPRGPPRLDLRDAAHRAMTPMRCRPWTLRCISANTGPKTCTSRCRRSSPSTTG